MYKNDDITLKRGPGRLGRPLPLAQGGARRQGRSPPGDDHPFRRGARAGRHLGLRAGAAQEMDAARRWRPRAAATWRWKSCTWFTKASSTSRRPKENVPFRKEGRRGAPCTLSELPGLYVAPRTGDARAWRGAPRRGAPFSGWRRAARRASRTARPIPCRTARPCHLPRRRTVAVAVESFAEYRRLFGGFEGPGRLPFAVASFFEQGGRRACVARVVHDYGDPLLDAGGVADQAAWPGSTIAGSGGTLLLVARSEGAWGNGLRAALGLAADAAQAWRRFAAGRPPAPCPALGGTGRRWARSSACTARRRRFSPSPSSRPSPPRQDGGATAILDRVARLRRRSPPTSCSAGCGWTTAAAFSGGACRPRLLRPPPALAGERALPPVGPAFPASRTGSSSSSSRFPCAGFGAPELPPPVPPQFAGGARPLPRPRAGGLLRPQLRPSATKGPGEGVYAALGIAEVAMVLAPDLYSPGPLVPRWTTCWIRLRWPARISPLATISCRTRAARTSSPPELAGLSARPAPPRRLRPHRRPPAEPGRGAPNVRAPSSP